MDTAASSAPVPQPELAVELAPPPDLLPRRAATVAGLPLVLAALALGAGLDPRVGSLAAVRTWRRRYVRGTSSL